MDEPHVRASLAECGQTFFENAYSVNEVDTCQCQNGNKENVELLADDF